mmetsp:Transcript_55043/g.175081  ORF Transcript_55043/g.175081 Transcript_55043/m.175081 type:complete len:623 (+) Transcript_55043:110-1978(+)
MSGNEATAPRWGSREEALQEAFAHLDKDGSGFIDLQELTMLASKVSPAENLEGAKKVLDWMDFDGDHKVTKEEFLSAFEALEVAMDDEMFYLQVAAIMDSQDMYQETPTSDYNHPANNREYLRGTVLDYLEPGLEKMLYAMQEERVKTASGKEWEEGWRPDGWKPVQALRWLGEWMLSEKERADAEAAPVVVEGPITFAELPRDTKMEMAFRHLDRDGSGYLDVNELMAMVTALKRESAMEEAQKQIEWLDSDGDNIITIDEYKEAICFMTEGMEDALFDESIRAVLGSSHLSFFSREEKLIMCFEKLDSDGSGHIGYDELVILGKALDPVKGEEKVLGAIEFMDQDGNQEIDKGEFLEAMGMATSAISDDQFDVGIKNVLDAVEADEARVADGADEFLPKFQELVRGLPQHTTVKQMAPSELATAKRKHADSSRHSARRGKSREAPTDGEPAGPLVIIDCRGEEEQEVSVIPDARRVPLPEVGEDGTIDDLDGLLEKALDLGELTAAGMVVVYSGIGLKGALVADALQELVPAPEPVEQPPPPEGAEPLEPIQPPKVAVYNLCGGMLGWWNTMGEVVDAEGAAVEQFHPHELRYMGYIASKQRPNKFKLKRKPKSPSPPPA